jgi:hypothetical protein
MALIRVFKLPTSFPSDFLFDGGQDVIFKQVDWFRDDENPLTPNNTSSFVEWIKKKRYANSPLLILHPEFSLTIDYKAP